MPKRRSRSSNCSSNTSLLGSTLIPPELGTTVTGAISNLYNGTPGQWTQVYSQSSMTTLTPNINTNLKPEDYNEWLIKGYGAGYWSSNKFTPQEMRLVFGTHGDNNNIFLISGGPARYDNYFSVSCCLDSYGYIYVGGQGIGSYSAAVVFYAR